MMMIMTNNRTKFDKLSEFDLIMIELRFLI